MSSGDLSSFSLVDLFRAEVETHSAVLSQGLVEVESGTAPASRLKELMRAAHSLKGAARIVNYDPAVRVAHAMEDLLVAAQNETVTLTPGKVDLLLRGVDLIVTIARVGEAEIAAWGESHDAEIDDYVARLSADAQSGDAEQAGGGPQPDAPAEEPAPPPPVQSGEAESAGTLPPEPVPLPAPAAAPSLSPLPAEASNRALRIGAENLNRLLGLAGESLLASRWLETFAADLLRLKREHQELSRAVQRLRDVVPDLQDERVGSRFLDLQEHSGVCQTHLTERLQEFDLFQSTFTNLSTRLYEEVLDSRMRPFGDIVQGFPRMVRDVARLLGKEARLELHGLGTPVDRDILDRLEAPLNHLVRNAVDHGLEQPQMRAEQGKPREGKVRLEARHSAGMLLISIADDGRGIDLVRLRSSIVQRQMTTADLAERMSEAELFEFLFLPGFSLKDEVTEISGRGVGLDAVQAMAREVGGTIRVTSKPGKGTQFQLLLPLTLSVIRTLIVEVADEAYAFPLARIHSVARLSREQIATAEGRQHFLHHGHHVGLVIARQILDLEAAVELGNEVPVVVLDDRGKLYGMVVDQLLDERELVVLALDPRLGKIPNISSAALMPDRSPVLIFDTEDLIRSIENLIQGHRLESVRTASEKKEGVRRKRVLVVDDSLTVRELERKLLAAGGYDVDVAVDGMDGWNAVRVGHYDLMVTDVDMPRMDGIELVTLLRADTRLRSLPVVIVSYKDRPEDRQRGLEAGADYYLTKGSFQDETLLRAVHDLIGPTN